jgi:adhesin HecA-like repeat protein
MDTRDVKAAGEDELTAPEQQVVVAAGTGALVDLRAGVAEVDDPATGAAWDEARTVQADVLVELLIGVRTPPGDGRLRAVRLAGARITGRLDLEAATLACPLLLQDCYLEQPIRLKETRAPVVRLPGCHVPGLAADQLETRGDLEINERFTATGEVRLLGAHIGGQLDLNGAALSNPEGPALAADRLTVQGSMFCGDGFTAAGELSLLGGHIGGQLDLSGASLTNPEGPALAADRLTVQGSMFCRDGFTATGEVGMLGAHIGGQLDLNGAALSNPEGAALAADVLTVDRDMFCRDGFTATGEVRLNGAHIGGQLSFRGASLTNPGGAALAADGLKVDGDMFCWDGFTATGEVRLDGAHIGGQLDFTGAALTNPDGRVLDLAAIRADELFLRPRQRPDGVMDCTNAHIGSFYDDEATWPTTLRLRGFVYDTLANDRVGVRARLGWLGRHEDGYTPQVYEQLAAAYRRDGREEAARRVLIAKQWRRRGRLNPWNWLLYATVGYGYRTWLALLWLLLALWVGTRALDQAQQAGLLAPAKDNLRQEPTFHPLTYALDLLLPIVNLGQEGAWIPRRWAEWWTWGLVLVGWVLTTAVVAGLTGVLKRD